MANNPYDVNSIFADMEEELIASYRRNMGKHAKEELKEGFKWEMWQARKLRDMKQYQKENRYIVDKHSKLAKDATTGIIKDSYGQGDQDAVLGTRGFKGKVKESDDFGIMNRRKMDALAQSAHNDLDKATHATLRKTDDVYRQVVYKAQTAYSMGATTLPKAIDMAAKDFLEQGINAIKYKNGNMVNIASYAEMAIRASAKKAYLTGEGSRNAELGVTTVQVTSYGACSDLCLPWQGKVYIDDVYSGGKKGDGEYPLLSGAMSEGLYHPNCRHTHGPFFEGISYPPVENDIQGIKKNYASEQKQRALERTVRKWKRVAEGSLDPDNVAKAQKKVAVYQKLLREHLDDNPQLRRQYYREKTYGIPSKPDKFIPDLPKSDYAQSLEELSKKWDVPFVVDESNGRKVDLDSRVYELMDKSIENMNSKLPAGYKFKDLADEVSFFRGKDGGTQAGGASHRKISINSKYWDSSEEGLSNIIDNIEGYEKSGKLKTMGQNPVSTLDHETGHLLHDEMTRKLFNKDPHGLGENARKTMLNETRTEVLKAFGITAKKSDWYPLSNALSDYGTTDQFEFFAEAFMENMSSKSPRPMAEKFWEVLMKRIYGVEVKAPNVVELYHGTKVVGLKELKIPKRLRNISEQPLAGVSFSDTKALAEDYGGQVYTIRMDKSKIVGLYGEESAAEGFGVMTKTQRDKFDDLLFDKEDRAGATEYLREQGFEGAIMRGYQVTGYAGSPDEYIIIHDVAL